MNFWDALRAPNLFPYDLRPLKQLESVMNPEVRLRYIALVIGCLAGQQFFDFPELLVWLALYLLWSVPCKLMLSLAPDEAEKGMFTAMLVLVACDTVIFNTVIFILWSHEAQIAKLVALVLLYAGMVNSVVRRTGDLLIGAADMMSKAIVTIALPVTILVRDSFSGQGWMLAIVILFSLIYFIDAMIRLMSDEMRRRHAERADSERMRLESLGQLTGGVAHDFNNLLTVIIGNLDLMKEVTSDEDRQELLDEIGLAAHRGSDLTSRLLVYSRKSNLRPVVTSIEQPIGHAEQMLRRLLPESITFETALPRNLPEVSLDLRKFETVIINLVLNARDAMDGRGRITVTSRARHLGRRRSSDQPMDLPDGEYVTISVSDTGQGIPEALRSRVLEPYFTTKPVGKGSGLGLPMAQGFAVQSGGALMIRSTEGVGTTVVLWFPVASEANKNDVKAQQEQVADQTRPEHPELRAEDFAEEEA